MARGRIFLTAGLLMMSAPDVAAAGVAVVDVAVADVAGTYRLHDGPDVASELVLKPDGTFTYFLSGGALDEGAQGRWQADGKALHLTTIPKPVAALFSSGAVSTSKDAALVLHVTGPNGAGVAGVDLRVGFDSGEVVEDYTQDYGWTLAETERRLPRWVEFAVPIYRLVSQRFAIDVSKGNVLTFVLTPNDLGIVDFSGIEGEAAPGRIVLHRGGGDQVFEAVDK